MEVPLSSYAAVAATDDHMSATTMNTHTSHSHNNDSRSNSNSNSNGKDTTYCHPKRLSQSQSAYERLLHPDPKSITLIAALQLLQPLSAGDVVYLLPVDYVQNWLYWAYAQTCVDDAEQARANEALKQAAVSLQLIPPTLESHYELPGPMDAATSLSVQGHPMVLKPTVRLHRAMGGGGHAGAASFGGSDLLRDDRSDFSAPVMSQTFLKKAPQPHPTTPIRSRTSSPVAGTLAKHNSTAKVTVQRQLSSPSLKLPPTTPPHSKKKPVFSGNTTMNGGNTTPNGISHQQHQRHTFSHSVFMSSSMNKASSMLTMNAIPNNGTDSHFTGGSSITGDNIENNNDAPECLAVPEAFYDSLRKVLGVLCSDGYTIAFQQSIDRREPILLQHEVYNPVGAPTTRGRNSGANNNNNNNNTGTITCDGHHDSPPRSPMHAIMDASSKTTTEREAVVPVEFRRKVISLPKPDANYKYSQQELENMSPMDRLLIEEERRQKPKFPVPEIHPIKLLYRLHHSDTTKGRDADKHKKKSFRQHDGFVLVSQEAVAVDALSALIRAAAPKSASQTMIRLWSRYHYPYNGKTRASAKDGNSAASTVKSQHSSVFELIDFQQMTQQDSKPHNPLTVGEWASHHTATGTERQIECLIELKPNLTAPWPRKSLELMRRLAVGDFCDAQDVAGRWYEARIVQMDDETVTVHYFGWASRWNLQLKRWPTSTVSGVSTKLHPPAPLWSRTDRWRERIQVGDIIEVRDTSSLVHRPKWYKGEVKKVGQPSDPIRSLHGGADLELYPLSTADGGINDDESKADNKEPLLLLDRCQQILVEVAQERTEKASSVVFNQHEADDDISSYAESLAAEPPFLRWVNLYGEEICQLGTHLKIDDETGTRPSTLKYELEHGRKPVEIMKSHPSLGGSGFMRESLRGVPPAPGSVGLHNLGNSCFLNSTVQCLNHMELITQYFLRDDYINELNRQNPLGSGGNVAMAYGSLLKKMWSGDYSILAPRSLKQTVAAFAPQFDNSYQHDSQEFCQFLMDGLHEDLNRVKTKPYVEELEGFGMEDQLAAIESWRKHLLRHDSIFVDHCQGMHRSHLTCPQCSRESIKFDVYSSISLPLASKKDYSAIRLEDCIDMFMLGEQLDERNAWYCPSCRRHVCALKLIALWSAPDILILHLKRFQFDTCMTSGGMLRSKLDDTVNFPIEGLDLTRFILGPIDSQAKPVYKLFGVSEHTGYTANSGHYTATVRNSIDGQWYRCNDSHVGRTSGEAAITGGAYVLFYQREKGVSRWAGMEKVMKERGINPYGALDEDPDGFKRVKTKKNKKKASGRL